MKKKKKLTTAGFFGFFLRYLVREEQKAFTSALHISNAVIIHEHMDTIVFAFWMFHHEYSNHAN